MDPNTTLELIRHLVTEYAKADSNDTEHDIGVEMADAIMALDNWICRGGLLPTAWQCQVEAAR
jgi:hypothetical protein